MTDQIQFSESDAEFRFRHDGTHFCVRTEVAEDSFSRVVVSETSEYQDAAMEPEGDE